MNNEQKRIHQYLKARIRAGQRYFRSRHMADELEMTPKCIGTNLNKLAAICKDISIRRWARSVSVTWYVVPV